MIEDHIKAVLFDFDDTLVATIAVKWAEHKYVAKKHYDKDLTDEELREHYGKPLRTLVGLLYGDSDTDRAMERLLSEYGKFPKVLLDDTLSVLAHLHDSGKKVGIITATNRSTFEQDLVLADLPIELFNYTQTEDESSYHKPDPRVFDPTKAWLKSQGIRDDEVVYVGDALRDMDAAIDAGFSFIGVGTGLVTPEEFQATGAKAIKRLGDLI